MTSKEEVLQFVEEEGVQFIRLAFYDLFGVQKNVSIMPRQLNRAFEKGVAIDASQLFGGCSLGNQDLIIKPDPSTMMILPWRSMESGVIHMVCDLYTLDGQPFLADTRRLLKRVLERVDAYGLDLLMAAKIEFYLFERDENGKPTQIPFDQGGYLDVAPKDQGENMRREICLLLEEMGFDPHKSLHQAGPGQNEVDFHFSEPLQAADEASIFKWVVRTTAATNGLYADFSPKPLDGQPGSAMHVQVRFLEGKNKLDSFIAGLIRYLPDVQLFMCNSARSHLRFKHIHAPKVFDASNQFRNVMVRIPPLARDVLEVRLPDSLSNPYLVFALVLMAGLKGVEEGLPGVINNEEDRRLVAASLSEAKEIAAESEFVEECLHPDIIDTYMQILEDAC